MRTDMPTKLNTGSTQEATRWQPGGNRWQPGGNEVAIPLPPVATRWQPGGNSVATGWQYEPLARAEKTNTKQYHRIAVDPTK